MSIAPRCVPNLGVRSVAPRLSKAEDIEDNLDDPRKLQTIHTDDEDLVGIAHYLAHMPVWSAAGGNTRR